MGRKKLPDKTHKTKPVKTLKFNHDRSIFKGELGLTKDDLAIAYKLINHIASIESERVALFENKSFMCETSNLYRVKYKLEALLFGKST